MNTCIICEKDHPGEDEEFCDECGVIAREEEYDMRGRFEGEK